MTTGKNLTSLKQINKNFGIKSTYDEKMYTTELREDEFTSEQKAMAARKEREIEESKKFAKNTNIEDEDEAMDASIGIDANYDEYVKGKKVIDFAEIEAKQLSNTSFGENKVKIPLKDQITNEDLFKKASFKSIDEFQIEGMTPSSKVETTIRDGVSEGSNDEQNTKTSLNK